MVFFVVKIKVENFDVWKQVYDSFEATRDEYGIREHYAIQSLDDANSVIVVGEGDLDNVKKFLASEDLKSAMAEAGVMGPPDIFIGENKRS